MYMYVSLERYIVYQDENIKVSNQQYRAKLDSKDVLVSLGM